MLNQITVDIPSSQYGLLKFPLEDLCRKGNIATPSSFDFFRLDCSRLSFASISHIVAIAQLYMWANSLHADTSIDGMREKPEQYASRMDLYKILRIKHIENFNRHDSDQRFVSLQKISDFEDVNPIAAKLTDMVTTRLHINTSVRGAIDYAFGEIMDNIVQHSGSRLGGIAAAQFYPAQGYLELCVSDCGKGIAETMSTNSAYRGLTPLELMSKAFEEGCGEKTGAEFLGSDGAGMGMGLTITERLVRATHGVLWAVSKGQCVSVSQAGMRATSDYWYPGTILVVRIPTNENVEIRVNDIYPGQGDGVFSWSVDGGFEVVEETEQSESWLW